MLAHALKSELRKEFNNMNKLKNTNVIDWLKAQKIHIKAHQNDIDTETLKETDFENNPIIYGCIREKGSEILSWDRVFYEWGDIVFYYRFDNLTRKPDGEIYGDILTA